MITIKCYWIWHWIFDGAVPNIVEYTPTTIFKEMKFWWVKTKALEWSYYRNLGIFYASTDIHLKHF